jgi:hypothetical protein
MNDLLILSTLLLAPTLVFCAVFGFCHYVTQMLARKEDSDEEEEKEEEKEPPYEAFYSLSTAELPETQANLEKKVVEDETPEGRVIMRLQDGLFEYWADKTKSYKYLETVARKYVIVYDCRDQYVNIFKELLLAHEALQAKKEAPAKVDSVFAQLKNNKAKPVDNRLVNARANRYKWRGKLAEFFTLQVQATTKTPKSVNYASYVQMHKIE